jgi:hypothetical protein
MENVFINLPEIFVASTAKAIFKGLLFANPAIKAMNWAEPGGLSIGLLLKSRGDTYVARETIPLTTNTEAIRAACQRIVAALNGSFVETEQRLYLESKGLL